MRQGKGAMDDWTGDAPGARRKITVNNLPPPGSNLLAINPPRVVRRPPGAELGDDLVPDYISSVRPGGFYGWPWFYLGNHVDPRHKGKHVDLAEKVVVPDVLV